MVPKKSALTNDGLVSLFTVLGLAGLIAVLYLGRAMLVPLSLAILFSFLLTPAVSRLERLVGRVAAVLGLVFVISFAFGIASWVAVRQGVDLMARIPDYRANIEKKIQSVKFDANGPVKRFLNMIVEVESEIPWLAHGPGEPGQQGSKLGSTAVARPPSTPLQVDSVGAVPTLVAPALSFIAGAGIVTLLVIFMLLQWEDIRRRFIKIVGRGRVGATTRAMEDAGDRVSRYLLAQLVLNCLFGLVIAGGLALVGVPNVFLWGALSALLRFVPYIGVVLASVGPITLAFAISPGWDVLLLTLLLFATLELVTSNLIEPLLFRSATGISSFALIVAAIFWAWLWGPVGLILSTPLTVCLAVIGKHAPRLSFFSVLLGDEEPLTPNKSDEGQASGT